jgi:hypothetical protein
VLSRARTGRPGSSTRVRAWRIIGLCTICAMKPKDTSNLLAAFALGVSALALIVSGFMAWRQNRLQARLTAIEEERLGEEVEARRHARVTLGIPNRGLGRATWC